jgi:aldose 1-epimerase
MFSILSEKLGPLDTLKILNKKTGEYAVIIPGSGAIINELVLKKAEHLHHLIDGCASYEELMTEGKLKFKGPKLFPFPNRIKDGKYSFEGKEYQLRKNLVSQSHAIHGLILDCSFKVTEQKIEEDQASIQLVYIADGTEINYPFQYKLIIDITLTDSQGLLTRTKILNESSGNIPLGDGWHPYFTLGSSVNRLKLILPPCKRLEADDRMIPTGTIIKEQRFKKPEKINDVHLDDCFQIEGKEKIAEIHLINEEKNIDLIVWQEGGEQKYNFFQIYTPPDRQSIAVEPMTCAPDAFNNKMGLIILKPEEWIELNCGIMLI